MIREVKISVFLIERKDRFKPIEANVLGLKRIDKIDFNGNMFFSDKETNTNMILVKKGDLVISGINVEKGALAVYEGETDVMATIHYSSYIFNRDEIDIQYLKWFLKSNNFRQIIEEQVSGGIKTEIKSKTFLNLKINLPDLLLQKEIVQKLSKQNNLYLSLLKKNNKNEDLIKHLRKSIFQSAIQGKLVPQDENDEPAIELLKRIKDEKEKQVKEGKIKRETKDILIIEKIDVELPSNWQLVSMNDIALKITDGEHVTPMRCNSGRYLLSARNVTERGLNLNDVDYISDDEFIRIRKRCNPDKGDILISCSGSVGRVCIVDKSEAYTLVRSVALVKINTNFINSYYLKYCISSNLLQEQIILKSKSTAQANLFIGKIKELVLPLPPFYEQNRIVEKIDKLMEYCDKLEAKVKSSKAETDKLMEAVLEEAFSN